MYTHVERGCMAALKGNYIMVCMIEILRTGGRPTQRGRWLRASLTTAEFGCKLCRLSQHSLRRRRLRGDLIIKYKMLWMQTIGSGPQPPFFIPPVRPGLRCHPLNVLQGTSRHLRRKSSFSTRLVKLWNRLHAPIETVYSINTFKRQFDSAWEELFAEIP